MSSIESKSTDFIKNNTERSIIKKLLRERCDKLYIEAIEKHSKKYKIKISCNPKESKLSFYQKHINQYALKLIDIATNNDFNLIIYDIEELKYTSDEIFNNIREIENNSIDLIYDIKPIYSTIHLLLKKIELDAKRNIDMIYSLMETLNKIEIGINKICYKLDEMKIASFLGDQIDNKKEELLKQFREEIQSKKELVKISINTAISTLSES
ncbi:MAG: hypothetical protein GY795_30955 [Desulfobacterales bacterium]|nr:hypothetical protein [Desulfobacterales bacterium]